MNDPERERDVRRWLRYAQEDFETAEILLNEHAAARNACFQAQQSVEKALKAALIFEGIDPPRVHNLNYLRNLLPERWRIKNEQPSLSRLIRWAFESRYPGDLGEPTGADAQDAVRQAREVLDSVRRDLARHGFDATRE